MKKYLVILFFITFFLSCSSLTSGYKDYYTQVSPKKYQPTLSKDIDFFNYNGLSIMDVYKIIFGNDFEIIGKSSFNGPYQDVNLAFRSQASVVGADVVIYSAINESSQQVTYTYSVPKTTTYYVKDQLGNTKGTITSYGSAQEIGQKTVYRYDQTALFLKCKNNNKKLWLKTENDFPIKGKCEYDGVWTTNNDYEINIFRSGSVIVGVINKYRRRRNLSEDNWEKGELKFIFANDTKMGLYFMNDKTPMPTKLELDSSGYISLSMPNDPNPIKMARVEAK